MSPETAPTPGPSPTLGRGETGGGAACFPFPLWLGERGPSDRKRVVDDRDRAVDLVRSVVNVRSEADEVSARRAADARLFQRGGGLHRVGHLHADKRRARLR